MIALISLLLLSPPPDGYALRLKAGDTWTVEENWTFKDPEDHADLDHSIRKVVYRVEKGDSTGYDVEVATILVGSIVGDDMIPPPAGSKPEVTKEHWLGNGTVTSSPFDFEHLRQFRLWRLMRPPMPSLPTLEGSWDTHLPSVEAISAGSASMGIKAKLMPSQEKKRWAQWAMSFHEDGQNKPMSASGKATIDVETGLASDLAWTCKSAPLPGGTESVDLELTARIVKNVQR